MKKKIFAFILLSTLCFLLSTSIASAWTWGEPLVPCGTSANPATCTRCDLFHLLKNLIDFGLFAIVPVGGTLLFILAGIYYILGAANPSLLGRGKTIFENSFYAIIMIALAWLITNTILTNLGDNVSGNWYSFQCTNPTALPTITPGPGPSSSLTPTPATSGAVCKFSNKDLCADQATACATSNCAQYADSIGKYSGPYVNVLKAIMFNESSCNIGARSGAGACGLMQLLPATANQFRGVCGVSQLITCNWLTSSANADKSICIASAYVQSLAGGRCGADIHNVAGGYNGGGGADGACGESRSCAGETSCTGGPKRRWECLYDNTAHTQCNTGYDETRNYVSKVSYCTNHPGF